MRILNAIPFASYINNNKNNKIINHTSYPNLEPLVQDTISFSGSSRKDFNKEMQNFDSKCFPSEGLKEFMLSRLQDPNNEQNIVELHKEYYSKLNDCETLEQAKEIYPEFKDVIDAKDIDLKALSYNNTFVRLSKNEIEGAKTETFSIEFLKKYYAEIAPKAESEYYNLSKRAIASVAAALNITMNQKYSGLLYRCINGSRSSEWMTKLNQDPEFAKARDERSAERMAKMRSNPEFVKKQAESARALFTRLNQDPEFAKARDERTRKLHQDPEYEKKRIDGVRKRYQEDPEFAEMQSRKSSERMIKHNQDPEFIKRMEIVYKARSLASKVHPYAHTVRCEIAKEFPGLKEAINKTTAGKATHVEKAYIASYYAEVHRRYPELNTEIGNLQKEILRGWGFYEKGENAKSIDELNKIAKAALDDETGEKLSCEEYFDEDIFDE